MLLSGNEVAYDVVITWYLLDAEEDVEMWCRVPDTEVPLSLALPGILAL